MDAAAGPPPPATAADELRALRQHARHVETSAYIALINDSGRPSHPLTLLEDIVATPGQYRDILAFWQDRSDEWQVFHKQLSRWRTFRAHQRASREPDRFPTYAEDLASRLRRHGFELPCSFDKPPSGFSRHITRQDGLATWVEYLNYEFTRRDEYDKWIETCRPSYDEALSQLVKSGVMQPFESVRALTSDICRPSSIEVTRRKHERCRAEEAYNDAEDLISERNRSGMPGSRQQMNIEDAQLADAEKRLVTMEKRATCISDFTRKTHAYRFALDRSERHELLLRWALDQVPLIEEEMRDRLNGARRTHDGAAQRTFNRFRQLPAEIRLKIWFECLATQPTVHFFDVLNHQRQRHLAHSWSSKEFRVRPTTARDSGYKVVYILRATCREARLAVETHYRRRSLGSGSGPQGSGAESGERHLDFRAFDWIPADDLVVLCFPPIEVPHLPATNAITIARGPGHLARHVGVLVPKEFLIMPQFNLGDDVEGADDAEQVSMMPEFVDGLHRPFFGLRNDIRPGVKMLYFIVEGWTVNHCETQSLLKPNSIVDRITYPGNQICWRFEAASQDDPIVLWKPEYPTERLKPTLPNNDYSRQLWWLGSGNAALGLHCDGDIVEHFAASKVQEFLSALELECGVLGWRESFEGVGFLGWMKKEQ